MHCLAYSEQLGCILYMYIVYKWLAAAAEQPAEFLRASIMLN